MLWSSIIYLLPFAAAIEASLAQSLRRSDHGSSEPAYFFKGHDLSSLPIMYDAGWIYKDTQRHNETRPAEDILGDGGMNTVRLRIWVNPPGGVYGLDYNLAFAKALVAKGFKIYLDFHYSDTWADPQHQIIPAAWVDPSTGTASVASLQRHIHEYTSSTILAFRDADIPLALVSLGNEIRHGTLWPTGEASVDLSSFAAVARNFTNLAHIYKAARDGVTYAVRAGASKPLVMIHIDNGWNLTLQERWFGALTAERIVTPDDWDVFGFSMYPFYGAAASFANFRASLHALAAHWRKPIMMVETDFPATGCTGGVYQNETFPAFFSEPELVPLGVQGQLKWMAALEEIVKGLPHGLGRGLFYWEPAWLNSTSLGSACSDNLLFDTDWNEWPKATAYSRKSVDMYRH